MRKQLVVLIMGVGLLAAACGAAATQAPVGQPTATPLSPSATVTTSAKVAPDIALATIDGEFRLSQQRGKLLLLYFSSPG